MVRFLGLFNPKNPLTSEGGGATAWRAIDELSSLSFSLPLLPLKFVSSLVLLEDEDKLIYKEKKKKNFLDKSGVCLWQIKNGGKNYAGNLVAAMILFAVRQDRGGG